MTLHTDDQEPDPADAAAWGGSGKSKPPARLRRVRLEPIGRKAIPPRRWAYAKFLLFGSAAVLGAVDGGGKGFITTGMVIAMITGRPLLGEKVWRTGPVAIITYEDDTTEWHRRIAAACEHYKVDYALVIRNIVFLEGLKGKISFANVAGDKTLFSDADEIIENLKEIGAVLLVIDPFNHAHSLDDGNSNALIAKVAFEMSRVAAESAAAVLVLHHLRKGNKGEADDLMGATSLRATFRSCRILCRMLAEDAAKMNLQDNWRYIRIAGSKENFAPPPDRSTWFKLESVLLENGTAEYPEGDNIAVATTWCVRPMFEGMDATTLAAVFKALQDTPHSPHKQTRSVPWGGKPLIGTGGRSEAQASKILSAWLESNVLTETERLINRNKVGVLTVDTLKVAEIMAGLAFTEPPPTD